MADLLKSLVAKRLADEGAEEARKQSRLEARRKLRQPLVEAMEKLIARDLKVTLRPKCPPLTLRLEGGLSRDGRFRGPYENGDKWTRFGDVMICVPDLGFFGDPTEHGGEAFYDPPREDEMFTYCRDRPIIVGFRTKTGEDGRPRIEVFKDNIGMGCYGTIIDEFDDWTDAYEAIVARIVSRLHPSVLSEWA